MLGYAKNLRFLLSIAVLWLAACIETIPATAVVVVVRADSDEVARELSVVRAQLFPVGATREDQAIEDRPFTLGQAGDGKLTLPFSFTIEKGKAERFLLVVTGFRAQDTQPVIERKLIASFVARQTVAIDVVLTRGCFARASLCAGLETTCSAPQGVGMCGAVAEAPARRFSAGDELDAGELMAPDASAEAGMDAELSAPDAQSDGELPSAPDAIVIAGACGNDGVDLDNDPATPCTARRKCVAGEHVISHGDATTDRSCEGCLSGTFSAQENAESCAAWKSCVAGSYVTNTPSESVDRTCMECTGGTFTDVPNQSACLAPGSCRAGTKQTSPGTASSLPVCETCKAGEYCAGGTTAMVACTGETWDNDANPATACVNRSTCVAGNFAPQAGNATTDRSCSPCPSGQFSTQSNVASCTPWTVCGAGEQEGTAGTATRNRTCVAAPWTAQFGALQDVPTGMALGPNNEVYVVSSRFLHKLSRAGVLQWSVSLESNGTPSVRVDASHNIIVAGSNYMRTFNSANAQTANVLLTNPPIAVGTATHYASTMDANGVSYTAGGIAGGNFSGQTRVGFDDSFVIKHDSDGSVAFLRQYGVGGDDYVFAIAVDGSGNSYAVGRADGAFPGETITGPYDAYVRKFSSSGTALWTHNFGLPVRDRAYAVAVDTSGNVFVGGWGESLPAGTANQEGLLRSYNSAGSPRWTADVITSGADWVRAVVPDNTGGVYAAGSIGDAAGTGLDGFVRHLNSAGIPLPTRQFGTSSEDAVTAMAVDASGYVYVAGYTDGTLPNQGKTLPRDVFVMKLMPQ